MHTKNTSSGFTLLIAIILSSVVLTLALALLDVAYKQVVLASSAKNSQYAFYNANTALECALYYDQRFDFFNTNPTGLSQGSVTCNGQVVSFTQLRVGSSPRVSQFTVPCAGGGSSAEVFVYKGFSQTPTHRIFANGYNSCNASDPRRFERGLKVYY